MKALMCREVLLPGSTKKQIFSPGNIVYGDMRFPKSIRTGDCKASVQFCSRMKTDLTWVFVIDVFESGNEPENDTRTATLSEQADMEGDQWWYRV